jgi:hypothetical protein
MLKEFREFAARGNVIDLAVAVIIGAAFGKIVTSVVNRVPHHRLCRVPAGAADQPAENASSHPGIRGGEGLSVLPVAHPAQSHAMLAVHVGRSAGVNRILLRCRKP